MAAMMEIVSRFCWLAIISGVYLYDFSFRCCRFLFSWLFFHTNQLIDIRKKATRKYRGIGFHMFQFLCSISIWLAKLFHACLREINSNVDIYLLTYSNRTFYFIDKPNNKDSTGLNNNNKKNFFSLLIVSVVTTLIFRRNYSFGDYEERKNAFERLFTLLWPRLPPIKLVFN